MKLAYLVLAATATLAAATFTPAAFAADAVDYAKSEITFVSKQMNVPVEGRFRKFSAAIAYDPAKVESSKAQIEVDLASVDTGSSEADIEVAKKTWFNTAAFPAAKFASTSARALGADRIEVKGSLSIKGISREMTVPVTVKQAGAGRVFEGAFVLPRLQFKIGEGVWSDTETVADEVQVRFRIVTTKK